MLGPLADAERQRIRKEFEKGTSARETLRALCALADQNIQQVFGEILRIQKVAPDRGTSEAARQGLCILALGGCGREKPFP